MVSHMEFIAEYMGLQARVSKPSNGNPFTTQLTNFMTHLSRRAKQEKKQLFTKKQR